MTSRILILAVLGAPLTSLAAQRPMTFLDVQNMRQVSGQDLSPDGRLMVYALSTPDWATTRRQTDLYLVSTDRGLSTTRQLTFTKDKNESSPKWSHDGSFIAFLSDRDATTGAAGGGGGGGRGAAAAGAGGRNQIYVLRLDGGEAKRITDVRDGVSSFSFSKDGSRIYYASGRNGDEQIYAVSVNDLFATETPRAAQLTRHATGIASFQFSPDGKRIYFVSPDSIDRDDRTRTEKQFTVRPRNPATSLSSLWVFDVDARQEHRLTSDTSYSVSDFSISPDGKWVGFHGQSPSRYERAILEQNDYADLYLLNVPSGNIERLTKNDIIGESGVSFSPDSKMIAFAAPDDFKFMHNEKIYVRPIDQPNAQWRKLGQNLDLDLRVGGRGGGGGGDVESTFWSAKGDSIYFGTGVRATSQFFVVSTETGQAKQLTDVKGTIQVSRDEEAHRFLINYQDPKNPAATYTVLSLNDLNNRTKWVQLTDPNAWAKQQIALGDEEEITWKSKDGTPVGGVLLKPVGYQPGKKYPLIVAIHGGPAAADMLTFNGGYSAQVYAGAGYMVLMPNYRASTQYGDKFKTETFGDYFTKGYQDIMTGVDLLIAQGLVDSTQMGALGWSAGGHYSNWIETHTNRFKAISSGAGVANWISMWSQSDTQRLRQWYVGDKMYWETPTEYQNWWKQSPIATVKNAKTPIFIHVVEGDPRVPRPQSEEMHMALSKLGVPNEFWVYPGNTHGIPDPRNQYLKAVAEMEWMDYWVRGSGKKFAWRDVLNSVQSGGPQLAGEAMPTPQP